MALLSLVIKTRESDDADVRPRWPLLCPRDITAITGCTEEDAVASIRYRKATRTPGPEGAETDCASDNLTRFSELDKKMLVKRRGSEETENKQKRRWPAARRDEG
jgi:hypothetical protein